MRWSWQPIARRIRVPAGFVFAGAFLWLARPTWGSLAGSLVLVAPGLALRAYAAGYVKKNAELTTTGPYAYTRNPLYLGSMLMAFGFAGASLRIGIVVALAALFGLIYVPTIRSEERYLEAHFAGFAAYARRVPRLVPRPWRWASQPAGARAAGRFAPALYRKHREYNALIGTLCLYLALILLRLYLHR